MNEYLQAQMDSQLFEGVDEKQKSEFVGNFFHFVKCRFSDCQTLAQKSSAPVAAAAPADKTNVQVKVETKQEADKKERLVTNTQHEVEADLKKQDWQDIVKPTTLNENKADPEPVVAAPVPEVKK